jgi:hypothetical protein
VFSPKQLETTIRRLDERCRVVELSHPFDQLMPLVPAAAPSRASRLSGLASP